MIAELSSVDQAIGIALEMVVDIKQMGLDIQLGLWSAMSGSYGLPQGLDLARD